jgi:hypothetical protein
LFSLLSFIFQDNHAFFRSLTNSGQPGQGKPLSKGRFGLEACAALLLAVPVFLFTFLAAGWKSGETIGFYLRKRPQENRAQRQDPKKIPATSARR